MRDFSRRGTAIRVRLSEYEVSLLESLVGQLHGLLSDGVSSVPSPDPFERWQAELAGAEGLDHTDPVIGRLFPDAYPDDPAASTEFRQGTQSRQVLNRLDEADTVLEALSECASGRYPVQVDLAAVDDWLKVLTALRLSLSVRLGIATADDLDVLDAVAEDDPRSYVYRVYEWLAYLSEGILAQLGR